LYVREGGYGDAMSNVIHTYPHAIRHAVDGLVDIATPSKMCDARSPPRWWVARFCRHLQCCLVHSIGPPMLISDPVKKHSGGCFVRWISNYDSIGFISSSK
jgi:hypothetical protein